MILKNQYRQGKLNGIWESYRSDGTKYWEGNYKIGLEDGSWTCLHGNGQKKSEGVFKEGKLYDGVYTEWNEKGIITLQGDYKEWGKEGIWRGYDDYGYKIFEELYQNGELIKTKLF